MRRIIIMKGLSASGKTSYIKSQGWEPYSVSMDELRKQVIGFDVTENGFTISQRENKLVHKLFMEAIERRMALGQFLVVDATHLASNSFDKYKDLVNRYNYRAYYIDVTPVFENGITEQYIAELIGRDRQRGMSQVGGRVILDQAEKYGSYTQKSIDPWIFPLQMDYFRGLESHLLEKDSDYDITKKLQNYSNVVHIGDIQACYDALKAYFDSYPYRKDYFYIFHGDILDRGDKPKETLKLCMELALNDNVVFLLGNHDIHLERWANGLPVHSKSFYETTAPYLEDFNKRDIKAFTKKMIPYCYYWLTRDQSTNDSNRRVIYSSHAGMDFKLILPGITDVESMIRLPDEFFTKGVKGYSVDIPKQRVSNNEQWIQIHGHRNNYNYPNELVNNTINLEGKVEFGGDLRVYHVNVEDFSKSQAINIPGQLTAKIDSVSSLKAALEQSGMVTAKPQAGYPNIFSYNFKNKVFYDKLWDNINCRARGLFIDTIMHKIVARSYNKFFNYRENDQSSLDTLKRIWGPLTEVYIKENGFLGIASYYSEMDKVLYCSKSTISVDNPKLSYFADLFCKIATNYYNKERIDSVIKSKSGYSFIFEVCDSLEDPHIIDYGVTPKLILLDVIKNSEKYQKLTYKEVVNYAELMGVAVKVQVAEHITYSCYLMEDILNGYEQKSDYNGAPIEGFILEDNLGHAVKIKTNYYTYWKSKRTTLSRISKGLDTRLNDDVDVYMKDYLQSNSCNSILDLRQNYLISSAENLYKAPLEVNMFPFFDETA